MSADGQQICKRWERMYSDAGPHFQRLDQMAPFTAPSRAGILADRVAGQSITDDVYDSTPSFAAGISAKYIAGSITNPASIWSKFKNRNPEANKVDSIREWQEECTNRWHAELNRSNFYQAHYQVLIDWLMGTGLNMVMETPIAEQARTSKKGLYFITEKIGRFLLAEDPTGQAASVFRKFSYTAEQYVTRWGLDKCSDRIKQAWNNHKPDERFDCIHAIEPRHPSAKRTYSGAKGYPWSSCYVVKDEKFVIEEGGFEEFPCQAPRYEKCAGEVLGRGPAEICFPDAKTLNAAKRMGFEDWALKIRPPTMVANDAVMGKIRLIPAGLINLRIAGRSIGDTMAPYQTGSHPEVSQIKEEELRKSIRQAFYVDQILMMMEVEKTEMTAYEFSKKIELMNRILGPVYQQLVYEDLNRLHERGFALMWRMGLFSPPPEEIFQFVDDEGLVLDTEFVSPLALAQKAGDVDAIMQGTMEVAKIGALEKELTGYTEVFDLIDTDKSARLIFDIRGVPATVTKSEDEVKAIRDARQKKNAEEEQQQGMAAAAEGLGKVAPFITAVGQQNQAA